MSIWKKRKLKIIEEIKISEKIIFPSYKIDEKEFWSLVDVKGENECWLWKGSFKSNGYGNFHRKSAHRVSYKIINCKFPKERFEICHKCNNPKCVNPNHLYAGTHKENMQDMKVTNTLNNGDLKGKTNKLTLKWLNRTLHNLVSKEGESS